MTTYTATVARLDENGNTLLIAAQATDTLAGLIEWGQMTRDDIKTPTQPLTIEKVHDFLTQAFDLPKTQTLTITPTPDLPHPADFPTNRQAGKSTSRKVGTYHPPPAVAALETS